MLELLSLREGTPFQLSLRWHGREAMGRAAEVVAPSSSIRTDGGYPMAQVNDLSRSLTAFDPISTLVVVVEMSKASWLMSGAVPGVERQPLKKLEPDATALLRLIERWRNEAVRAGRPISRIALAYEAGRDGFWLARWLIARGIEAHVIHSASVAVSRERKRAKTDRLDAAMLMRVFLGWLRGERGHCGMVAIPTMEEEDARRPSRERESLVDERSRITNRMKSALARLGIRGFKPHLRKVPERLAGLPDVPERQCAGAVVSHADRGAERRAQDDDDRGAGAQTADSAVAPGHDRRGAGRCRAAAGGVSNTLKRERTNRIRHLSALDAHG